MLYVFFWVITRLLEFLFRRLGTLCLFHLRRQVDVSTHIYLPMKMEQSVPKRRHINSRRQATTQKKADNKNFAACLWQVKVYTCVFVIIIAVEMFLYLKCRRPFYHEAICTVHHYSGTLGMMAQLYNSNPERFLWHWMQMQALRWGWVLPDLHNEGL